VQKVVTPYLIKINDHITAGDNFPLGPRINFREYASLKGVSNFVLITDYFAFRKMKPRTQGRYGYICLQFATFCEYVINAFISALKVHHIRAKSKDCKAFKIQQSTCEMH
jgi:hypothetical protein